MGDVLAVGICTLSPQIVHILPVWKVGKTCLKSGILPVWKVGILPVWKVDIGAIRINLGLEHWNSHFVAIFSASSIDLKRIQTLHNLLRDFWADTIFTTRWSGGKVQVWDHVQASAGHMSITSDCYSKRKSKGLTANDWQWLSAWAALLPPCWLAGQASAIAGRFHSLWQ